MFGDKGRGKRLQREAKAINRKAIRNGGNLSGREAARLTKVKGQIVKFSYEDASDETYDEREY